MKFTKEQAFEQLKGFLTNNGKKDLQMSERSINEQLEILMPLIVTDEMELDDFIGKVKTSFEVMNANVKKDNSDFVNQWKKDHPDKTDDRKGDDDRKPDASPELKEILERMKALEEKNSQAEREKAVSQKRRDLKKKLKEKGVDNEEWCEMVISEIPVPEDLDTDAKAESLLKLYNTQKAKYTPGVAPLVPGKGGENNKGLFADIKANRQDKKND